VNVTSVTIVSVVPVPDAVVVAMCNWHWLFSSVTAAFGAALC
jgi:hypothetical protein